MDREQLKGAISRFAEKTILVAGDIVLDEFMYTEIDRVSREAPVFICRYQYSDRYPGCAGNTAMNLRSLGAMPVPAGLVGRDEDGRRVSDELWKAGMDLRCLQRSRHYNTMKKMRILAGGVHRAKQHMLRVDREGSVTRFQLYRLAGPVLDELDGIVISDYGYNTVTPENTSRVIRDARARNIPVFLDSRYRITAFKHVDAITPNEEEAAAALKRCIPENGPELKDAMKTLARWADCKYVLLTRGSKGMVGYHRKEDRLLMVPIFGSPEPVDVSGAGDSVMAAFSLGMVSGLSFDDAVHLANMTGGISVMQKGTYAVKSSDLMEALDGEDPATRETGKISE